MDNRGIFVPYRSEPSESKGVAKVKRHVNAHYVTILILFRKSEQGKKVKYITGKKYIAPNTRQAPLYESDAFPACLPVCLPALHDENLPPFCIPLQRTQ